MMIAEAAREFDAACVVLDPTPDAPAFAFASDKIVAPYDDVAALVRLCQQSDVVTYEFENIPARVITPLCERYNVRQGYKQLLDSQDRLHEKRNAQQHGLQTPPFEAVDDLASLKAAVEKIGLPAVLKTRTLGYDGRGQMVLKTEADIAAAEPMLSVPCILEGFVEFDFEVSLIMIGDGRDTVMMPIGRNKHRDGILDLCILPSGISAEMEQKIFNESRKFMRECGYRGILTIEYFVKGEEVIFNEMAPRPHNSGHFSIEGATTSQFREMVKYLLDIPLEQAELSAPNVIMKNILGEDMEVAEQIAAEAHEGVYVHLYGKSISKPKRKMGHITFVGLSEAEYNEKWRERFKK